MNRIYCKNCAKSQPMLIEPMTDEKHYKKPWGDLVCRECSFVIATITVDEPGVYEFVKVRDL